MYDNRTLHVQRMCEYNLYSSGPKSWPSCRHCPRRWDARQATTWHNGPSSCAGWGRTGIAADARPTPVRKFDTNRVIFLNVFWNRNRISVHWFLFNILKKEQQHTWKCKLKMVTWCVASAAIGHCLWMVLYRSIDSMHKHSMHTYCTYGITVLPPSKGALQFVTSLCIRSIMREYYIYCS